MDRHGDRPGLLSGGTAASARAINDVGQVVGTATDSAYAIQRVMWDQHQANPTVAQCRTTIHRVPRNPNRSTTRGGGRNREQQHAARRRVLARLAGLLGVRPAAVEQRLPDPDHRARHQQGRRDRRVGAGRGYGTPQRGRLEPQRRAGRRGHFRRGLGVNDAGCRRRVHGGFAVARVPMARGQADRPGRGGRLERPARAVAINNTGKMAGTSDGDTIAVVWTYDRRTGAARPWRDFR